MTIHDELLALIDELQDENLSRLTTEKLDEIRFVLGEEIELSLRLDRIREILASIQEDPALPIHVRASLWNFAASLELL